MRCIIVAWFLPSLFAAPLGDPLDPSELVVPLATADNRGAAFLPPSNHVEQAYVDGSRPSGINWEHSVSDPHHAQHFDHRIQNNPSYLSDRVPNSRITSSTHSPLQLQMMVLPHLPLLPFLPHEIIRPSEAGGSHILHGRMQQQSGSLPPIIGDSTAAGSIRYDHQAEDGLLRSQDNDMSVPKLVREHPTPPAQGGPIDHQAEDGLLRSQDTDMSAPKLVREHPTPPAQGAPKRLRTFQAPPIEVINANKIQEIQEGLLGAEVLDGIWLIQKRPILDASRHEHLTAQFTKDCFAVSKETGRMITGMARSRAEYRDFANVRLRYVTIKASPFHRKSVYFMRLTKILKDDKVHFLSGQETVERLDKLLNRIWHYHDVWLNHLGVEDKDQAQKLLSEWLWGAFNKPKDGMLPVLGFTTQPFDEEKIGPDQRLFADYLTASERTDHEDATSINLITSFLCAEIYSHSEANDVPHMAPEQKDRIKVRIQLLEAITAACRN